ncbi:MAG TPA: BTAD domain-containing putative transcriptional regulator [Candidatus Limnocylindrales bacterium]|nr:BTAD domain-containing putative transcriptional regulator [Candidatus Limnocylindrales bacterium]
MQFRILGSLEAVADGVTADLGPPKQRSVLAILLMHAGEIVPTDRLIDLLWADHPPRTAAHSVQIYVSELRKVLEPLAGRRLIATRQPGYQLDTPPETIDAHEFEALVEAGRKALDAGERERGTGLLRSAHQLWRGPALSDFAYEEFAQPYIRRLHDLHLDAIEDLVGAELEAGRTTEVLPLLDAAVREDPLRERSRELLMLALYRSGRHAEALRTFERLRILLAEELGLDPSPPLQRMQERVLLHDPSLLRAPAAGAAEAPVEARNPYKGLRPFGEEDVADFFGRDTLVEAVLDRLGSGARLVALVGPSGSGKSSVVAAGVVPRLRSGALPGSDRWVIAFVVPGARPMEDIEAVVSKATGLPVGLAELLDAHDGGAPGSALRTMPADARLVIVMDQFEELFTVTEEPVRRRFLEALAAAVSRPGGQVVVLLTLRGDFYDRPLSHAGFGEVFVPAVMNVLPMTAEELESAVVGPLEGVGVTVEPGLLAQLVAETADQPGALPLLQFALTDLFDHRTGATLTLAAYREIGGLHGILSRRAETVYAAMDTDEQRAAMQVFLRLVRPGRGTIDSRRRIPLQDLTDLDLDPVVLSEVLGAFARHRLLSFDRDPISGVAVVEVAHEALLREWDRLAGWIDRYRTQIRRHETLAAAVEEWELSGRDDDYVLAGGRLAEFEAWSQEAPLTLTTRERAYLEAGLARRRADQEQEAARLETQRRLERRARIRLLGLAAAVLVAVGALGYAVWVAGASPMRVAFMHGGRGEMDTLGEDGFERGVSAFNLIGTNRVYDERNGLIELRSLSDEGVGLIIVNSGLADGWEEIVGAHPATRYAFSFPYDAPNVSWFTSADQEGSFLAGAAAAEKTTTGVVGFIGGLDDWFIWQFEAGFEAGARAVDPDIVVLSTYLAMDYVAAFDDPLAGRAAAVELYERGADVVFHAAGTSGMGLLEAARDQSRPDRHLWAIGVDTDQYQTVGSIPGVVDAESLRRHILTSMLKRADMGVYNVLEAYAKGKLRPGPYGLDLENGGLDLSRSGGFIDDIYPRIADLKAQIIAGVIDVPCATEERRGRAAEAAERQGVSVTANGCRE